MSLCLEARKRALQSILEKPDFWTYIMPAMLLGPCSGSEEWLVKFGVEPTREGSYQRSDEDNQPASRFSSRAATMRTENRFAGRRKSAGRNPSRATGHAAM